MPRLILKREPNLTPLHKSYPYQAEALNAIRNLEYGAIFHEQGLGKTKIAIDIMLYWLEKKIVDTVLFVVKKGLVHNWITEIRTHTHLNPPVLTQNRHGNYYVFNGPSRTIVGSYEVIKNEKERMKIFLRAREVGAVLDESAKIKNPDSSVTKAFFEIAPLFKRRIILTGLPVANRPYDIWAQIWFLDQGKSLGHNFVEFKRALDLSNKLSNDREEQQRFEGEMVGTFNKISRFTVRETKKKGVIKLPEKIIERIETDWEDDQWQLYRTIRDEERAIVMRDGLPCEDNSEIILKRLMRLVQVASNPKLVDSSYSGEPGKLETLFQLVENISARNEKCIIWTSFTDNVDWFTRELQSKGACKVHGKMGIEERNRSITKFKEDRKALVLIATPGAAKEGLTLTVANHVIFFDRSFSLDDYLQAQDRIHRISQEKTCYVYNLIMKDSIDEWVDVLLHTKELAAQLTQGDISLSYYRSQISYEFSNILKGILNIEDKDHKRR
jgi:SNF2 family DNA or RNA helicase